jgi:hypothetical protein
MSLKEERMQILKMLEEGKINVEEAANLLSALEAGANKEQRSEQARPAGGRKARWLRIRVTDEKSGQQRVNINLPIGIAGVAMKMGAKFAPDIKEMDMRELFEAIETGIQGKIIDVHDGFDGEHVEIFVE